MEIRTAKMMIDTRFLLRVCLIVGTVGLASAYPLWTYGSPDIVLAVAIGCGLSVLNAVCGSLMITYAFDKPSETFLKAVLGGMGIRVALLLTAFFVMIKLAKLHTIAFSTSLLGFYVIFLVLEIFSMQQSISIREQQSNI